MNASKAALTANMSSQSNQHVTHRSSDMSCLLHKSPRALPTPVHNVCCASRQNHAHHACQHDDKYLPAWANGHKVSFLQGLFQDPHLLARSAHLMVKPVWHF